MGIRRGIRIGAYAIVTRAEAVLLPVRAYHVDFGDLDVNPVADLRCSRRCGFGSPQSSGRLMSRDT
jgi:hypothetical protein